MGNIRSRLTRPLRTFNIESRTERVLEREKPAVAPTYTSVEKQRELAKKLNPDFMETHNKKDAVLGDRLKAVFVTSEDSVDTNTESTKQLPMSRQQFEILEFGVYEPSVVPAGRCTLRQAVKLLHDHKVDPVKHTVDEIAKYYNMDKEVVANILHHYRILYLQPQLSCSESAAEDEPPFLLTEYIQVTSKATAQNMGQLRDLEHSVKKRKK